MTSDSPRVLISYSHDSDEHDQRVLALAQDLRRDGIDAWIDRFEPAPPQGWPTWMHEQVTSAQFVVLVCTPTYRRRFDQQEQPGVGRGVSWEAMMVKQLRYEGRLDGETLVPVYFEGTAMVDEIVPLVVRDATNHALPGGYAKLVDRLTRRLAVAPVPLGSLRSSGLPTEPSPGDPLAALYEIRERLTVSGSDTRAIDAEILELRRALRNGPKFVQGYVLAERYSLIEELGKGGFAEVWNAYDRRQKERVAVKILHRQFTHDRSAVERFQRGARTMAKLHHGAIVPIRSDAECDDHHHFFVMPLYEGGDLRRAVTKQGMGRDVALTALADALEGLAHAHSSGFVHRDVKPDNILLDQNSRGSITDFDLVHHEQTTAGTRTNAGLGTAIYAAPECWQNAKEADASADVYGAAMSVLFVFLARDPPLLVALTEPQVIAGLACDRQLDAALRGALAYRREERTTTCEQLTAAIRDFVRGGAKVHRVAVVEPSWHPPWAVGAGEDGCGRWALVRVGAVEQRMRWITPGSFMMGSPESDEEASPNEKPQHPVALTAGFWLAETPCTKALWWEVNGNNPSRLTDSSRLPVEQISWDDVEFFLQALNARVSGIDAFLPTEAQWEYACRAGTKTPRYGRLDDVAWHGGNSERRMHEVAQKQRNPWGLFDMLGNVYEWCANVQDAYGAQGTIDPAGSRGPEQVIRGGCWRSSTHRVRAADRRRSDRGNRIANLGFRFAII